MKRVAFRHPANARFLKIYQWQLDFCDGKRVRVGIDVLFRVLSQRKASAFAAIKNALEKAVLFYKRDKISQGVKFLASKGVIELHSNPEPRLWLIARSSITSSFRTR